TAVDPAAASLEVARTKPGADRVRWIHGYETDLPRLSVDLATMTGNVAQVFLTDEEWDAHCGPHMRRCVPADAWSSRPVTRRRRHGWSGTAGGHTGARPSPVSATSRRGSRCSASTVTWSRSAGPSFSTPTGHG